MQDVASAPELDLSALVFIPGTTQATLQVGEKTETYDYLDIPDPKSSLVVQAKAAFTKYLNLESVLKGLDRTIDLLYLGYIASLGTWDVGSMLSDSQIALSTVCSEGQIKFTILSNNVSAIGDRIVDALYELSLLNESKATAKLSSCAKNFNGIKKVCHEYSQTVSDLRKSIRKTKGDVEVKIGKDEQERKLLKSFADEAQANEDAKKGISNELQGTLKTENERIKQALKDYHDAQRLKDKLIRDAHIVEVATRVCQGVFSLGISEAFRNGKDTGPDTSKLDEAIKRNNKLYHALLSARKKDIAAKAEALKLAARYHDKVAHFIADGETVKAAEACMEISKFACNQMFLTLTHNRDSWEKIEDFCTTLNDVSACLTGDVEVHEDRPKKERQSFYKTDKFKTQCIRTTVSWQAVTLLCSEYSEAAKKYKERVEKNIAASPTVEEAQAQLKPLNDDIRKKLDEERKETDKNMVKLQKEVDSLVQEAAQL